jgi:hypothetical protein
MAASRRAPSRAMWRELFEQSPELSAVRGRITAM